MDNLLDAVLNAIARGELTLADAETALQELGVSLDVLAARGTDQQRSRLAALRTADPESEEAQEDAATIRVGSRSEFDNFLRTVAQGATFGFADELASLRLELQRDPETGLLQGPRIVSDPEALEASRQRIEDLRRTNPGATLAGEAAGGLLTPIGPAAVSGVRRLLGLTGAPARRVLTASGIAAGEAAVAGFGEGEGGAQGRALSAALSLPLGALLGAGFGKLGGKAQDEIQGAAEAFRQALDEGDDEAVVSAGRKFTEILRRHEIEQPEQVTREIRGRALLAQRPTTGADRRAEAVDVARRYMEANGFEARSADRLADADAINPEYHRLVAEFYDQAADQSDNPEVVEAYRRFAEEVDEQFEWLTRPREEGGAGVQVEFTTEDPYGPNSRLMMEDVLENGRLKVFATPEDEHFHPLLTAEQNNKFRAVHDYFGHFLDDNTFAGHGEESATRAHMLMFSDQAQGAMLTETRGQNSWFNFGPHSDLPAGDRPFAEQKAFILPDFFRGEVYPDRVPSSIEGIESLERVRFPEARRSGPLATSTKSPARSGVQYTEPGVLRAPSAPGDEAQIAAHMEFDGSTFDPKNPPVEQNLAGEDLWAVADRSVAEPMVFPKDRPPTAEDLAAWRLRHAEALARDPDLVIGTWFDKKGAVHGGHELNITRIFRGDQQDAAVQLGREGGEYSLLNLAHPEFEDAPIADAVAQALYRAELDEVVPARRERRAREFFSRLTRSERRRFGNLSGEDQERALRNFSLMPTAEEGATIALIGAEAQKWYQTSARTLEQMFGVEAPRFTGLLAATSPNIGIEKNMAGALHLWRRWNELGRRVDDETLKGLVQEITDKFGIAPSALNNVKTVLNAEFKDLIDPRALDEGGFLSGLKVDAFYSNLLGNTQRVVIDTHMLSGAGTSGATTVNRLVGMSPHFRQVADLLTTITGRTVEPREVQAMQWATIKSIRDLQTTKGKDRAMRVVQESISGGFFDAPFERLQGKIAETPSFASLMHAEDIAPLVREAGLEPPPLLPNNRADLLDFDPSFIREADLVGAAQRMGRRDAGQLLFGLAAMAATMAGEDDQQSPIATALAAGMGIPGGAGRLASAWSATARAAARAAGVSQDGIQALERAGLPMAPVMRLMQENAGQPRLPELLGRLMWEMTDDPRAGRELRDALLEGFDVASGSNVGRTEALIPNLDTAGRETRLSVEGLDEDALLAIQEQEEAGARFLPAFFDEQSQRTIPTGLAHDFDVILDPVLRRRVRASQGIIDGFFDRETGRFFNRDEAASILGLEQGESSLVRQAEGVNIPGADFGRRFNF